MRAGGARDVSGVPRMLEGSARRDRSPLPLDRAIRRLTDARIRGTSRWETRRSDLPHSNIRSIMDA